MTKEKKILTGIITAISIIVSMAGWAAVEGVLLYHEKFVTVIALNEIQNNALQFEIEDELGEIQERIDNGTATAQDVKRKAILKDRLKRIN